MKLKHLLLMIVALAIGVSAQAQTKGEKLKEFADKYLHLSGYLQGGFRWDEGADPETTFYLHRARLSLTGDVADNKIDYRIQVDMAGSPKICDLYFRYKPLKALNIELGQFKIPFSYENENCGPTTVEFIEYSYITTYLARNNNRYDGIAATGRDIGFQIYGGFIERDGYNIINYNLGVFNGNGINLKDHNSSKDYIARLVIKPFKGFVVTGSYMYAETEYANNEYMKSPRWAVGALYDSHHWVARSEYAEAMFGNERTRAFYALAGYKFEKPWSIFARYEFINGEFQTKTKDALGNDLKDENGEFVYGHKLMDEQRIQLGVAYKPFKFLRIQSNLSYTMPFMADVPVRKNSLGFNLLVTAMF
ncbi:MAG: porin [Alistipes sp.]|nr:porin [Alistipes sp.]